MSKIRTSEPEIPSDQEIAALRGLRDRIITPTDITGGSDHWLPLNRDVTPHYWDSIGWDLYIDHLLEFTADHGVNIDGVHFLDGQLGINTETPDQDIHVASVVDTGTNIKVRTTGFFGVTSSNNPVFMGNNARARLDASNSIEVANTHALSGYGAIVIWSGAADGGVHFLVQSGPVTTGDLITDSPADRAGMRMRIDATDGGVSFYNSAIVPGTSEANSFQLYSADIIPGEATAHIRTEDGTAGPIILGGVGTTDNALVRTNGGATYNVQGSLITVDDSGNMTIPGSGEVILDSKRISSLMDFYNCTFVEAFDATVASDGATITMSLEKSGGGDLTMVFSDGFTTLDTAPTPDTIALTAGSDSSPQTNYIYILQSDKILTKSTSGWPAAEHIKIGFFFVQSATGVQTAGGTLINQNHNNDIADDTDQGDLCHIGEKLRLGGADYFSGVDPNGDASTYFVITAGNVEFKSTAGIIFQKHRHIFPAFDTSAGDIMHIKNWSGDAFHNLTNLFDITDDSTGTTIGNNKYFNMIFWGVQNKTGQHQTIMGNLPAGFYNTRNDAENDVLGYDDFTIPREFNLDSSVAFLICRVTIQMGGTWTHVSAVDLRGSTPQTASGGASGVATSFADNVFDIFGNLDNTKIGVFDIDTDITTGNTRTLTWPDVDTKIWADNGSIPLTANWDVGNFTLTANGITIDGTFTDGTMSIEAGTISGITQAITDNSVLTVDDAAAADNMYGKFTAAGMEGRTFAEVLADLSGQAGAGFDWNAQVLSNIGSVETVGDINVAPGTGVAQIIILSADSDAWCKLDAVDDSALILYENTVLKAYFQWNAGLGDLQIKSAGDIFLDATGDIDCDSNDLVNVGTIGCGTITSTNTGYFTRMTLGDDAVHATIPFRVTIDGTDGDPAFLSDRTVAVFQNNPDASGNAVVTIIGGTSGQSQLWFGDSGSDRAGQIAYNHGSNSMAIITNNTTGIIINSTQVVTFTGTTINMVASGTTLTVGVGVDNGTVSAGVFTDRTKYFEGDALTELCAIRGKDGQLDHDTLPEFTRANVTHDIMGDVETEIDGKVVVQLDKVGEETVVERDLGATVSMQIVAIQQLEARVKQLEKN